MIPQVFSLSKPTRRYEADKDSVVFPEEAQDRLPANRFLLYCSEMKGWNVHHSFPDPGSGKEFPGTSAARAGNRQNSCSGPDRSSPPGHHFPLDQKNRNLPASKDPGVKVPSFPNIQNPGFQAESLWDSHRRKNEKRILRRQTILSPGAGIHIFSPWR